MIAEPTGAFVRQDSGYDFNNDQKDAAEIQERESIRVKSGWKWLSFWNDSFTTKEHMVSFISFHKR